MRALFKEIRDFHRFFKLPKEKKQVVFYSEQGSYYAYFEGLIEELLNHGQNICYITSDLNDPIFKKPNDKITPLYIKSLLSFFMPLVDCQVMIMTLTDLDNYHLKRSKNPVHYVYVFHALVSTHMVYSENAFDNYDSILCAGPHHVNEIRRKEELKKLKPKNLIEAGYYRLERIHDRFKKYKKDQEKKTILVAPSWGKDNIIESCGEKLVDLLLQAGYQVILRPHPETLKRSPDLIKNIEFAFGNRPDFKLEKSVLSDDSLLEADALISDYSGIVLEYALGTGRPVIFIDVPPKVHNAKFNELNLEPLELSLRSQIGKTVSPDKIDLIPRLISMLTEEMQTYPKKMTIIREQNIYNFGRSSEVGAKHILELL